MNRATGWLTKLVRAPFSIARLIGDHVFWPLMVRSQGVRMGSGVRLVGRPRIHLEPGGEIRLGRRSRLVSRGTSNPLQLQTACTLNLVRPDARITIGENCGLSGTVIVAANSVQIGRDTLIGANCLIIDTDLHPLAPDARRLDRSRGVTRPIVIGDDVFVGAHAIVLKGTKLGDGCVVGAGAVVAGSFPPGSVVVGNPARVVRNVLD